MRPVDMSVERNTLVRLGHVLDLTRTFHGLDYVPSALDEEFGAEGGVVEVGEVAGVCTVGASSQNKKGAFGVPWATES